MEKLIPFEKLSKKEQRKRNAARRAGWCGLNPVPRKPENPKAYNRRKARKWSNDSMTVPFAMPAKSAAFYLSVIFPAQYSFARRQQGQFAEMLYFRRKAWYDKFKTSTHVCLGYGSWLPPIAAAQSMQTGKQISGCMMDLVLAGTGFMI